MKKTFNQIEEFQGKEFSPLSRVEGENAWDAISARIETSSAFPIAGLLKVNRKPMIPLLIGALLFASAGGTVAASNSAVPGDTLFGVDRAVENVRLALSRGDSTNELRLRFAEERLLEVQALVAKARAEANASSAATTTVTTVATSTATTTASSTASTTPKKKTSDNVALGVNFALAYLSDISADLAASGNTEAVAKLESVIDRLETLANTDDVRARLKNNGEFQLRLSAGVASSTASTTEDTNESVKINTSGNKTRVEVREDGDRFRIEIKDNGNVKIKSKSSDDKDEDDENEDDKENEDESENDDKDTNKRGRGGVNLNSNLRIDLR